MIKGISSPGASQSGTLHDLEDQPGGQAAQATQQPVAEQQAVRPTGSAAEVFAQANAVSQAQFSALAQASDQGATSPDAPSVKRRKVVPKVTDQMIEALPSYKAITAQAQFPMKPNTLTSIIGSRQVPMQNIEALAQAFLNVVDDLSDLVGPGKNLEIKNLSSILARSGKYGPESLRALVQELKAPALQGDLEALGLTLKDLSPALHGAGKGAAPSLRALVQELKAPGLQDDLEALGLTLKDLSSALNGAATGAAQGLRALVQELKAPALQGDLEALGLTLKDLSSALHGAGTGAAQGLRALVQELKAPALQGDLEALGLTLKDLSPALSGAGKGAAQGLRDLVQELKAPALQGDLEALGLTLKDLSSALHGAGKGAAQGLRALVQELKAPALQGDLEALGLTLKDLSSALHGAGKGAAPSLRALVQELKAPGLQGDLEALGLTLKDLSPVLSGAGKGAAQGLRALVQELKAPALQGDLEALGLTLKDLSSALNGSGKGAAQSLRALVQELKAPGIQDDLEALGLTLKDLSSALSGAGKGAAQGLRALVQELKAPGLQGDLEALGLTLKDLSPALHGAGRGAAQGLRALVQELKAPALQGDLEALGLTLKDLSPALHGAGTGAAPSLRALVQELKAPALQGDFEALGLTLKDLSSALSGAGTGAAPSLRALVQELKAPGLQDDLEALGLTLKDLCTMLHGAGSKAPEILKRLLTTFETHKMRLPELDLTPSILAPMLRGAGLKAPEVLENILKSHINPNAGAQRMQEGQPSGDTPSNPVVLPAASSLIGVDPVTVKQEPIWPEAVPAPPRKLNLRIVHNLCDGELVLSKTQDGQDQSRILRYPVYIEPGDDMEKMSKRPIIQSPKNPDEEHEDYMQPTYFDGVFSRRKGRFEERFVHERHHNQEACERAIDKLNELIRTGQKATHEFECFDVAHIAEENNVNNKRNRQAEEIQKNIPPQHTSPIEGIRGLVAKKELPSGTPLVYAAQYLKKNEMVSLKSELAKYFHDALDLDDVDAKKIADDRLVAYQWDTVGKAWNLYMNAYGAGNAASLVNHDKYLANMSPCYLNAKDQLGKPTIPTIMYFTTRQIEKGEQLLVDYGLLYNFSSEEPSTSMEIQTTDQT